MTEYALVWREKKIRARVVHRCADCGTWIYPRVRYVEVTHLYDGRWFADKSCLPCRELANALSADLGYVTSPGCLYETLGSYGPEPVPASASMGAHRFHARLVRP